MLYYSGVMFIILCLGMINNNYKKKGYLYIIAIILAGIAGLRSFSVGVDSLQYYNSYYMIAHLPWNHILDTRYETGYAFLCKLLSYVTDNPQFLFLITSIFINGVILWFIYKYSPNFWLSCYLYISMGFFYNTMNILRQSLAMCIVLLALPLLLKKKIIVFILLVLLASQFHSSALVVLLLPLALLIKSQKKLIYITLVFGVTGLLFGEKIFSLLSLISKRYSNYTSNNFAFTNYFATLINALIALIILLFYLYSKDFALNDRNNKADEKAVCIDRIFLFILMIYFTFELIAMKANIFERAAVYYSLFCIIILPVSLSLIKNEQYKKVFFYFIITFTYLENMIVLYFRPNWTGVVPYELFK